MFPVQRLRHRARCPEDSWRCFSFLCFASDTAVRTPAYLRCGKRWQGARHPPALYGARLRQPGHRAWANTAPGVRPATLVYLHAPIRQPHRISFHINLDDGEGGSVRWAEVGRLASATGAACGAGRRKSEVDFPMKWTFFVTDDERRDWICVADK